MERAAWLSQTPSHSLEFVVPESDAPVERRSKRHAPREILQQEDNGRSAEKREHPIDRDRA